MSKIQIILLIIGLVFLYNMVSGGVRENLGSDFFHRGKLSDIHQHIQKQVAEARKRYGINKQEDFAQLHEMADSYKTDLKKSIRDEPIEQYEPSRYVISDYSFKELKPVESKEVHEIQAGMLETDDFAQPIDYSGDKPLAEYLEADKYDSGSGDMSELSEAYKMLNSKQYFQTLKALRVRGGNVHIYPTKECKPTGGSDIVGFEGY